MYNRGHTSLFPGAHSVFLTDYKIPSLGSVSTPPSQDSPERGGGGGQGSPIYGIKRELPWGGEHTAPCTGEVL